jgi:hypothetical protein
MLLKYLTSAIACIHCNKQREKENDCIVLKKRSHFISNSYMESSLSYPSKTTVTCMTLDTRALCVVCGAPAIGMTMICFREILFEFSST